jgi:hypothetical protein
MCCCFLVIASTIQEGDTIDQETIHMSMSPTLEAWSYQLMYASGNYIRVVSEEEHLTTSDSGVVATWKQVCVSGPNDLKGCCKFGICGGGSRRSWS